MRIVTFAGADGPHLGVVDGDALHDVTAADRGLRDLVAVLAGRGLGAVEAVWASAPVTGLAEVALLAPVLRPPKFLGIGRNYRDHAAETGHEPPAHQLWFNKQSTCVIGPGAAIEVPAAYSTEVDYEGELGLVIGRRCRHVSRDEAPGVVAGWLVVNDVSVRDWQSRSPTFTMGKSWDTHGPLGPWLVTADEVPDPHRLHLRTWVNDDLRQDAWTSDLIFDCWAMIEHLSTAFTLEPGDVITTGTPAGVGMARTPPAWLKAGDRVRIEIEGIGLLENPVIEV
jgi:2-keto-4-pentenoate hydratase/2-oxohepta-3-ene-1,7-dioic acid hydratase in catechol pathway